MNKNKTTISGVDVYLHSKKMSEMELQEHLKNVKAGVGIYKNKKKYSRKQKHKGQGY